MRIKENLVGRRFGRLVVTQFSRCEKGRSSFWICKCDCGTQKEINRNQLTHKKEPTRSCGCLQRDSVPRKHGKSGAKIYKLWSSMKRRCHKKDHPQYPDYGGRGIRVCLRWRRSFDAFISDMGEPANLGIGGLSIDRRDNDKGYNKNNCRWATSTEQAYNTRRNILVVFRGRTQPLKKWCLELGITYAAALARWRVTKDAEYSLQKAAPYKQWVITFDGFTGDLRAWGKRTGIGHATLRYRLLNGWPVEKALTTKPR